MKDLKRIQGHGYAWPLQSVEAFLQCDDMNHVLSKGYDIRWHGVRCRMNFNVFRCRLKDKPFDWEFLWTLLHTARSTNVIIMCQLWTQQVNELVNTQFFWGEFPQEDPLSFFLGLFRLGWAHEGYDEKFQIGHDRNSGLRSQHAMEIRKSEKEIRMWRMHAYDIEKDHHDLFSKTLRNLDLTLLSRF